MGAVSATGVFAAPQSGSLAHGAGTFGTAWLTWIVSFVIVIALILLSRYGLQLLEPYLSRRRQTRNLAVVESLAIDQRRRISIIKCGEKKGLILTGGGNDVFLGWMENEDAARPASFLDTPPD
ncbi:flagellar biosynthetic protein FliO [Komagataeibacter sp. FNDCR2]|uniref:flagellar biosynthetic protein FliO n=1 Tax=Komagataeibacter sp. FNDCR2 TaxID=2878682 RepID=UPI001E55E12C|nr:flagellar biosynthetic protein FliO [Komagataeibacter sp. FNDCR2]MCE2576799.1 flagellar biosynthetic protein FliO [Komagataeibacter sp. FNDCR2]